MPKYQNLYINFFHTLAFLVSALLVLLATLFLTHFYLNRTDLSYTSYIPADSSVFAYKTADTNLPYLRNNLVYFQFDNNSYQITDSLSAEIVSTDNYKNYNLHNLATGRNFYAVKLGGYYFLSTRPALESLIDALESGAPVLTSSPEYNWLKSNQSTGTAHIYLFSDSSDIILSQVFTFTDDSATLLSHLDRSLTTTTAFGIQRQKIMTNPFTSVPSDVCFAMAGTSLRSEFTALADIFSQNQTIFTNLFGVSMMSLSEQFPIDAILATNTTFVYYPNPTGGYKLYDPVISSYYNPDSPLATLYDQYATDSAKLVLVANPACNPFPFTYLETQLYDDRMLTLLYFE